jgi:hypothetical protein
VSSANAGSIAAAIERAIIEIYFMATAPRNLTITVLGNMTILLFG